MEVEEVGEQEPGQGDKPRLEVYQCGGPSGTSFIDATLGQRCEVDQALLAQSPEQRFMQEPGATSIFSPAIPMPPPPPPGAPPRQPSQPAQAPLLPPQSQAQVQQPLDKNGGTSESSTVELEEEEEEEEKLLLLHVVSLSGACVCDLTVSHRSLGSAVLQEVAKQLPLPTLAPLASLVLLWEGVTLPADAALLELGLPSEATIQLVRLPRDHVGEHARIAVYAPCQAQISGFKHARRQVQESEDVKPWHLDTVLQRVDAWDANRDRVVEATVHNVFDEAASHEKIFSDFAADLVESVAAGFNATIWMYGHSTIAKQFAFWGGGEEETQQGLLPRALKHLKQQCQQQCESQGGAQTLRFELQCSALGIDREQVHDLLLATDVPRRDLLPPKIRERRPGSSPGGSTTGSAMYVEHLTILPVETFEEVEEAFCRARTAASRRNSGDRFRFEDRVFTVYLDAFCRSTLGEELVRSSQLRLVDMSSTSRHREMMLYQAHPDQEWLPRVIPKAPINLQRIVASMWENTTHKDRKRRFIPYRDAKLTWLLKDSLGGSGRVGIMVVTPRGDEQDPDALNSLQFARRAVALLNYPQQAEWRPAAREVADDEDTLAAGALPDASSELVHAVASGS